MMSKSPVYMAVEQVLALFDLSDKIALFSYRDDFPMLWELDSPIQTTKSIWCVVDDSFGEFRWLPIGVWGHYYRAKGGFNSPRLILIGEDEGLNPKANIEAVFVPDFYRKEEDCIKTFKLTDMENSFILNLNNSKEYLEQIQSKEEAEAFSPKAQSIEGWKGIIRNTLSLPEKRHRVSNEIAPVILRKAIENKRGSPNITKAFLDDFPVDNEKRSLLTLWEWVSSIKRDEALPAEPFEMTDVWGIWSKAKYLLIDDQGRQQGYDKILKCALAIMMKKSYKEIDLDCTESTQSTDDIISQYACLFLDLRLSDKDHSEKKFRELDSFKLAVAIAKKCPAFPIIVFSSSQLREIDRELSKYANIICSFRKPGIAGSLESIDGNRSLQSLFDAISSAFEMIENRIAFDEIKSMNSKCSLTYHNYDDRQKNIYIATDKSELVNLFKEVFWHSRYDKAFTFPYSFFEREFDNKDLKKDLTYIEQIGIIGADKVEVVDGDLAEKASAIASGIALRGTKITLNKKLLNPCDLIIDQKSPNLNLNIRFLNAVRNLYSHGIKKYDDMRREAIVVLLLFLQTLKNEMGSLFDYSEFSNIEITSNQMPLIFPYKKSDLKKAFKELFILSCYYGKSDIYEKLFRLVKSYGSR